jgi:hypothetical protein
MKNCEQLNVTEKKTAVNNHTLLGTSKMGTVQKLTGFKRDTPTIMQNLHNQTLQNSLSGPKTI